MLLLQQFYDQKDLMAEPADDSWIPVLEVPYMADLGALRERKAVLAGLMIEDEALAAGGDVAGAGTAQQRLVRRLTALARRESTKPLQKYLALYYRMLGWQDGIPHYSFSLSDNGRVAQRVLLPRRAATLSLIRSTRKRPANWRALSPGLKIGRYDALRPTRLSAPRFVLRTARGGMLLRRT